ncbi:MAG TPA: AAA family ATPase [Polyangiaceae bacterium]|nr:AAA family ATPase [Polyangiaceae bacterium]
MTLPPCPGPPTFSVDWQSLHDQYAWIRAMQGVPQNPLHHAEGDVWVHTRLVCEALSQLPEFRALPEADRSTAFWAALLHDVSKPACTREEGGSLTARGHSTKGELEARCILFQLGATMAQREHVARLVQVHQLPYFAIDKQRPAHSVIKISQVARCDLLALLCEADIRGRECADKQRLLDNVELFRELCREQGCFDAPFAFASAQSRFEYFRRDDRDPHYAAHDSSKLRVTLMCGLPGSGKDTWLANTDPSLPVISLDAIRRELGTQHGKREGEVITHAKERARKMLRDQTPFVWNATNLTRKTRRQLIDLFADYDAHIRVVYCEAPWNLLQKRNRERAAPVPEQVLSAMLQRWSVPDLTEAHSLVLNVAD